MLLLLEWPATTTVTIEQEQVKSREEIMNILEAFDLCGSLRGAGELAGVSHHAVAHNVAERDEGRLPGVGPVRRLAQPEVHSGQPGDRWMVTYPRALEQPFTHPPHVLTHALPGTGPTGRYKTRGLTSVR